MHEFLVHNNHHFEIENFWVHKQEAFLWLHPSSNYCSILSTATWAEAVSSLPLRFQLNGTIFNSVVCAKKWSPTQIAHWTKHKLSSMFIILLLFITWLSLMTSGLLAQLLWAMLGFIPISNLRVSFLFFVFLWIYASFSSAEVIALFYYTSSRSKVSENYRY